MASTELEDFRQAARECMHYAAETSEPEIKASYEDLAGSYQHLAHKAAMWAAGIEAERIILDAARTSLAAQKRTSHLPEQPYRSNHPGDAARTGAGSELARRLAATG